MTDTKDKLTDLPRHEPENPFNYTQLQLATRKKAISDAVKDFQNIPEGWIEWMYDYIERTPKEEIERIIDNKEWEVAPKERQQPGVVNCMEIIKDLGIDIEEEHEVSPWVG